jgi:hypothetical protein
MSCEMGFIKNWEGMGGEGPNTSLVYIYIKKLFLEAHDQPLRHQLIF